MKKCLKKYRAGVILYSIIADIIDRSVNCAVWLEPKGLAAGNNFVYDEEGYICH